MTGSRKESVARKSTRREARGASPLSLDLVDQVAGKILRDQARKWGRRVFVEFEQRKITYGEANDNANRVANGFLRLGAKKGSRVAILLRNRPEYLDLWFGLSKVGMVQVPLNTEFKRAQLVHVLRRSPVDFIVTEAVFAPELALALNQVDGNLTVIQFEGTSCLAGSARVTLLAYEACMTNVDVSEPDAGAVSGSDMGAIMNTSGTTGPSKGVQLSHAQQFILGRNIATDLELTRDDVYYNFFPLFHNTAQAMITLPTLLSGGKMILTEKFSASRFWPDVRAHKCTSFYYIGEILRILLKSAAPDEVTRSTLRVGWGIGASPRDFIDFQKRYKIALHSGYGSTEANVPCFTPHIRPKPGSAGRVLRGFDVRVVNEQGVPLPVGQTGELLVRSSEPCATMLGYDGDAQATLEAWRDLWFHTGDAGYFNKNGDLFFCGRLRDVIRVRGENVSAFEIEETIAQYPGVLEVAAVAVPCELGGDDIKIVVVVRPDVVIEHESLVAHAAQHLPRFSVPRYVEILAALPKTETNKIRKNVLRSTPFTDKTWDRQAGSARHSR